MKNKIERSLAPVLVSFIMALSLSSCASSNTEELKSRIADLESENTSLKSQLAILKDSFAKSKISELKQALTNAPNDAALNKNDSTKTSDATGSSATKSSNDSITTADSAAAESATPSFSDLDETPTKDMILGLAQLHVFDGVGDHFYPNKAITRAEYIEWLYKSYNALEPEAKQIRLAPQLAQVFKDTPPTYPQYKYVQALSNAGFSIGYDDGTFRPDKPLTREEMLAIKIGVDVGKTLPPWRSQMDTVWKFSDGKSVDERYTGFVHQDFYVSGLHGSNIQRAFGKIGTFRPKQPVLRYEAAATLWQMGQFGDTEKTNVAEVLKAQKNKSN